MGEPPAEILSTTTRTGNGIPSWYEEVTYEIEGDGEAQFFRIAVSIQ